MNVRLEARWVIPLVFILMTVVPGINVALTGRDIMTVDTTGAPDPSGLALWLLRGASLLVVALSGALIGQRLGEPRAGNATATRLGALGGFLVYFASNFLSPALVSVGDGTNLRAALYVGLFFVAIGTSRRLDPATAVEAIRWSLLAFFLASFAYGVLVPAASLSTFQPTLRLPYVPFRFWGLGSTPNSIGPLALVLILVTVVHPSRRRLVDVMTYASGGLVLLLAQSQTAWIAAGLILPALLVYRRQLARGRDAVLVPPPGLVAVLLGAVAGALCLWFWWVPSGHSGATVLATPGINGGSEVLTGRSQIWDVALRTFWAHPLLGYGLEAWDRAFREGYGMPFASHAHNQLFHALSTAGAVGAAGLVAYVVVLVRQSLRAARMTGGLAPALLALTLIRGFSEVPLNLTTLLVGETLMHALLFVLLVAAASRRAEAAGGVRAPQRAWPHEGVRGTTRGRERIA